MVDLGETRKRALDATPTCDTGAEPTHAGIDRIARVETREELRHLVDHTLLVALHVLQHEVEVLRPVVTSQARLRREVGRAGCATRPGRKVRSRRPNAPSRATQLIEALRSAVAEPESSAEIVGRYVELIR